MKASTISGALAFVATTASAIPFEKRTDYAIPPGGFENIEYPKGTGENLPSYPTGTGENLPSYPPPPGGYENVNYPPGTGANAASNAGPFNFTSTFHIVATPDQVVNGTTEPTFTGGLPGCTGFYDFGINSNLDLICWSIKLVGFRGEYRSPARTATHVHSAAKGKNGPPRLAFPNPTGDGNERFSFGCMQGPFTTGLVVNGADTGIGFKLSQIEANPSGFMADVHSSLAVPGAVRGQFA